MSDHDATRRASMPSSSGHPQDRFLQRIGLDLHDGIAQGIASSLLRLSSIKAKVDAGQDAAAICADIASVEDGLRAVMGDLYALILQLRPPALDADGVEAKIRSWIADFAGVFPSDIVLTIEGVEPKLSESVQIAALRITQEAVANAVRRGGARSVDVSLTFETDVMTLVITDDGAPEQEPIPGVQVGSGTGMAGIEARASWLGGSARFCRVEGGGRLVGVEIPIWRPESAVRQDRS